MKSHLPFDNFLHAILYIFILFSSNEFSQQVGISEYQYLSPLPGSSMNQPQTNIIIKYGAAYNLSDILDSKFLSVSGEKSGVHSGHIILAENDKTILFKPDLPFSEGETVTVKFIRTIKTEENESIPILNFSFQITGHNLTDFVKKMRENS